MPDIRDMRAAREERRSEDEHRSIGALLVDAGRLSTQDAETVLRHQKQHDVPFGEAAIRLGLASRSDIDFALASQFDYPYLLRGDSAVSESVIAAYDPFSPQVEAVRALRTQLLLRLANTDRRGTGLAIVSAEERDGRSYLAANLAVVFAQLGQQTLLVDADMRRPCQHTLFGIDNRSGLSAMLAGRTGFEAVHRIPLLPGLSVLPAGAMPPNPQELLQRPAFTRVMDDMSARFDVVIVDTPSATRYSEALTVASRVGTAVIVARKDVSHVGRVRDLSRTMVQAHIGVVGAVLNDF